MRFCDVVIMPLVRGWPADLALCPPPTIGYVRWQNQLCEDTKGSRKVNLLLFSRCPLRMISSVLESLFD